MSTRDKLKEAKYFLDALVATQNSPEVFNFNLSAFLSSWKSVLDVMLYDFVDIFHLGLTREDRIFPDDFFIVAKSQKNKAALEFLGWWNKKRGIMSSNPLWSKRDVMVHRGGYPKNAKQVVYSLGSMSSSIATVSSKATEGAISPLYLVDSPQAPLEGDSSEILRFCKDGYFKMEEAVKEAENQFGVQL